MGGRSIFLKYWNNMSVWSYSQNRLPGGKPGISGSCVGGSNVGINLSSSPEKQQASATVIEYMTSRETQKRITMTQNVVSGIMSLYDEEEVCEVVNCKLIKSIQLVNRPIHVNNDYDSYSTFFRSHIFEFLYGNKTAPQVLNEINDYTKIYKITLNTKDTSLGLFFAITIISLITIITFSLALLYIKKIEKAYNFLSKDLWFISIFGLLLILCSGFLEYGDLSFIKCHLKWALTSLGITLNLIPILFKLIINFPEQNKYSIWVNNNKYRFISIFILFELFIVGISFIKPYKVILVNNLENGGKNFMKCSINGGFGIFVHTIFILSKVIIFIGLLLLIFIEWNNEETYYDIRTLTGAIYLDILDIIF